MTEQPSSTKPFVERLSRAVEQEVRSAGRHGRGRHLHTRGVGAPFATVANPARARSRDDLMAERTRAALD